MERVVYILGAGFSAPIGIPTVANFIQTARDLYTQNSGKFQRFRQTLDDIHGLARVKNLFHTDTFDLEEVLSILQTEKDFGKTGGAQAFIELIKGVIEASTPPPPTENVRAIQASLFSLRSDISAWDPYVYFVASLFRLHFGRSKNDQVVQQMPQENTQGIANVYDVISFNYDVVLETAARYLDRVFVQAGGAPSWLEFRRNSGQSPTIGETGHHRPLLAKLHGCCEMNNVVAPTAAKTLSVLKDQWELAYEALTLANHVRVIGYSLPDGDPAVRYLLKAAMSKMDNPKSIDVLCYDPDGQVAQRYGRLFDFPRFRFISARTESYLGALEPRPSNEGMLHFANNCASHHNFFARPKVGPGDKV